MYISHYLYSRSLFYNTINMINVQKPRLSLGAGVVVYNTKTNKILLVKDKYHNYWGFPKGGIDRTDKSAKHAAVRELYEETGINIRVSQLNPNFYAKTFVEDIKNGYLRHRIIHFYEYRISSSKNPKVKLQESELSKYTWASPQEAHQLLENEFQFPILLAFLKRMK